MRMFEYDYIIIVGTILQKQICLFSECDKYQTQEPK